jgi:hypothetical protein
MPKTGRKDIHGTQQPVVDLSALLALEVVKISMETNLDVRLGVATGIVVGDRSSSEVGGMPNLAGPSQIRKL